jgi:hypothetical protein
VHDDPIPFRLSALGCAFSDCTSTPLTRTTPTTLEYLGMLLASRVVRELGDDLPPPRPRLHVVR